MAPPELDKTKSGTAAAGTWTGASLEQVTARLCAPGALFEMETVEIGGIPIRTWKHQPRNLPALARRARDQFANNTFLVLEDERITYESWFRAVATLAEEMHRCGISRGHRVALAMRNLPEWPVVFFAATSLGAIVVPLNAWWTGPELQYGLAHSGARLLVCDEERWQRIRTHHAQLPDLRTVLVARTPGGTPSAPAHALEAVIGTPSKYESLPEKDLPAIDIDPDADATIFYTSGTSGRPKGALGSHRNILTSTLSATFNVQRSLLRRGVELPPPQPKATLLAVPLFHVTACNSAMMSILMTGSKLVLMHKWDPVRAFELIEREKVTNTGGVPTIAWQLIEHPARENFDLSSLELVSYGGAPSAPELVRRIHRDLKTLPGNGWGMTETSAAVTIHCDQDYLDRPDSCGIPLPVSDIKIMSEDGAQELPTNVVGELWASGPQIVKGYWRDSEATRATFIDGWIRTGDLARVDEDGFCYIVDRAKDVIIRGGENIYANEVENLLYEHPAVSDAALVGIPHRTLGEEPAAVVFLTPTRQASEAELQEWLGKRLAAFKVPARILFHDSILPRNANGKILKRNLKILFEQHSPGGLTD